MEPFTRIADALEGFLADVETNMDSFGQQQNDETYEEMIEGSSGSDSDHCETGYNINLDPLGNDSPISYEATIFLDQVINENIRSLNDVQRKLFDVVQKWSRDFIKNLCSKVCHTVKRFYIFLTDGAGYYCILYTYNHRQ